jgi:hypothetical protein
MPESFFQMLMCEDAALLLHKQQKDLTLQRLGINPFTVEHETAISMKLIWA